MILSKHFFVGRQLQFWPSRFHSYLLTFIDESSGFRCKNYLEGSIGSQLELQLAYKNVSFASRSCICVYEISQIRESVNQIPKKWQGCIWSGKKLEFQVWFVLVSLLYSNHQVLFALANIRNNCPPGT